MQNIDQGMWKCIKYKEHVQNNNPKICINVMHQVRCGDLSLMYRVVSTFINLLGCTNHWCNLFFSGYYEYVLCSLSVWVLEKSIHTCTVEEDLCFRVVVVDIMVVVSMKVVDISGDEAVVLAEPATLGTSPTNLTLPLILTLALPSAAMFNTLRPL